MNCELMITGNNVFWIHGRKCMINIFHEDGATNLQICSVIAQGCNNTCKCVLCVWVCLSFSCDTTLTRNEGLLKRIRSTRKTIHVNNIITRQKKKKNTYKPKKKKRAEFEDLPSYFFQVLIIVAENLTCWA